MVCDEKVRFNGEKEVVKEPWKLLAYLGGMTTHQVIPGCIR